MFSRHSSPFLTSTLKEKNEFSETLDVVLYRISNPFKDRGQQLVEKLFLFMIQMQNESV